MNAIDITQPKPTPPPIKPTKDAPKPKPTAPVADDQSRVVLKFTVITASILIIIASAVLITRAIIDSRRVDYATTHELVSAISARWNKIKATTGVSIFATPEHIGDIDRLNRLVNEYEQAVYFLSAATGLRDPEIRSAYDAFRPISDAAINTLKTTGTISREDASRVDTALLALVRISHLKATGTELPDICGEECMLAQRERDSARRVVISDFIDAIRDYEAIPDAAEISSFVASYLNPHDFIDPTTNNPFDLIGWSARNRRDPDVGTIQYGGIGTICTTAGAITTSDANSVAVRTRLEDNTLYCRHITIE